MVGRTHDIYQHVAPLSRPDGSLFLHGCCFGSVTPSVADSEVEPQCPLILSSYLLYRTTKQKSGGTSPPWTRRVNWAIETHVAQWFTVWAVFGNHCGFFWCMLSSRLNKMHIWLRLGFLRFYGCKTQPSNEVSTKCSCPENTRTSLIADFSTLDLLKPFWGDLIFCNHTNPMWDLWTEESRVGQKGMRKYEGIQAVHVLGYSVTCLLFSLGAGNPHAVSVTPDGHRWSSDDLINLPPRSPLPSVLGILKNIPADWQKRFLTE